MWTSGFRSGSGEVFTAERLHPDHGTDHVSGPRKQESGDTGTLMTVEDYGRFLDFVARGGITPSCERLLSAAGAYTLTRKWLRGLNLDTGLARFCDCAGTLNASLPKSFQFGWSITNPSPDLEEYQKQTVG